ncbi:hypothetical protein AXF42_Ash007816 [Apostasia shenzhenica]|uniref:Uncharacterized protein n=1 Tax=Apostasia shenzhenica TaxID=1088818 RepID=A0A2I0B5F1_9ASPA|nr:hypothetical protein AXF42_Ash007816 [Apostasia shenzhenica]
MASVGRLLLVLFLGASTAPALTSAQPPIGPNIYNILNNYRFQALPDGHELRLHVVSVAIALYRYNARLKLKLLWPEINSVEILGAAFANGFFWNHPISFFTVTVRASVAGMFHDDGEELQGLIVQILFAVPLGHFPAILETIPGSLFVEFYPSRPPRGN